MEVVSHGVVAAGEDSRHVGGILEEGVVLKCSNVVDNRGGLLVPRGWAVPNCDLNGGKAILVSMFLRKASKGVRVEPRCARGSGCSEWSPLCKSVYEYINRGDWYVPHDGRVGGGALAWLKGVVNGVMTGA